MTLTGLVLNATCFDCPVLVAPFGSVLARETKANNPAWARNSRRSFPREAHNYPFPSVDYLLDLPSGTDIAALSATLARLEPYPYGGDQIPAIEVRAFASWRLEEHGFYHPYSPSPEQRRRTFVFVALLAGFGVLEIVLLAGVAFGARRRARDLGLLAAQGATRRDLGRVGFAEALALGTLGSAVGVGAGLLATRLAHARWERGVNATVDVWQGRPSEIAAIAGLGLVTALLAALFAALAPAERRRTGRARRWTVLAGLVLLGAGLSAGIGGARDLDSRFTTTGRPVSDTPDGTRYAHNYLAVQHPSPAVTHVLFGSLAVAAGVALLAPSLLRVLGRWCGRLPAPIRRTAHEAAGESGRTGPVAAAIAVAVAVGVAGRRAD